MKWRKLGQIFKVSSQDSLTISHASNPLAISMGGGKFRIFFSARDCSNRSSVTYVDLNLDNLEITKDFQNAVFSYGPEDSFFSHGVSIGNCYESEGKSYILFMGWQIRGGNHWRGDIGRLQLIDNKELILDPSTTFLSTDNEDPISLSYPWVIYHDGKYKMWYGSTISWTSENGEMIHVIKYATSNDGISWQKHGLAIPYEIGIAQAFSRPVVIIENDIYHMWYSYRSGDGTKYRVGYSQSSDGVEWTRKHELVGIDVSEDDWDSEMICYPFVFDYSGNRYMLYNGNGYGKTGFGIAILEQD